MYETQYSYFINPATKKFLQTNEAHSPITTPPSFYFGDRPKFALSFPADTLAEGDTLVAVIDNENRFLDTKQATGLNPVMAGVLHEVTSEEANAQSLEIQLFDYSKKFADVINGHDNAVTCLFTVYLKSTDGEGNFTFVELGQTIANGEPTVTSPECVWDDLPVTKYYTREELDAVYNQFLAGVSLVVEYSNLAKSYAVGGTGTREGEDTDNAKYYAEMASQAANAVSTMYSSIQTLATQIENTKDYIDGLVESIAIDIRDISEIAASVTANAAQVSRDAQSVRQAKSSIDASVQFVTQAKSTVANLATQVSQNAVAVANDKDAVAQLAVQVSNAASQVSRDKADAKGYSESAATSLANVQTIQADVTQKQTSVTTMKNTIQGWYNKISTWYNSIQSFMEQMQGWWTDVDTWQQQVSEDKDAAETARNEAVTAKNAAETAQTKAETAQSKAETAQTKAEEAQTGAEDARDEAIATLASKRDILQTLVTSSATYLEVEAGKSYNWTVSAASTIALATADKVAGKETRIDIYIDLQDGGSVTGDGVSVADAVLQSGWYKLIWDGTDATLYSTKAGGAASVITIPAATTSYTLQDNKHYQQIPSAVPTYTLPTATMDGLVHEITVLVDFMHVTSCSFVDASGVPVTLQSAISPQIGEAYIFRCYWYGKWRVVPLKIRNAATASSANGVVEVSDAVGGDALALKMTAPRSVVVNQLVNSRTTTDWLVAGTGSTVTFSDDIYTVTVGTSSTTTKGYIYSPSRTNYMKGHKYALYTEIRNITNTTAARLSWRNGTTAVNILNAQVEEPAQSSTWISAMAVGTITADSAYLFIGLNNSAESGASAEFRNMMCVDLTQYFNGDTALINSITTWDDLVAYDPRFAQYVAYNTGEVKGVVPAVSVNNGTAIASPSELFAVGTAADEFEAVSGVTTHIVKKLTTEQLASMSYQSDAENASGIVRLIPSFSSYGVKAKGYTNIISNRLPTKPDAQNNTEGVCGSNGTNGIYIYILANKLSGNLTTLSGRQTAFRNWVSENNFTIYYELDEPTTSSSTPTQISLQAGNNVVMQTDGGRTLAELAMIYENLPTE